MTVPVVVFDVWVPRRQGVRPPQRDGLMKELLILGRSKVRVKVLPRQLGCGEHGMEGRPRRQSLLLQSRTDAHRACVGTHAARAGRGLAGADGAARREDGRGNVKDRKLRQSVG